MPAAIPFLPIDPPQAWTKPTAANTKGGKLYKATHPDLFRVEFSAINSGKVEASGEESYSSRLIAARDFAPDSVITPLNNICQAPSKAYSSVQFGTGPRDNLELNTDILFMNHSCAPTVYVDLPRGRPDQWCLRTTSQGLAEGEPLTFFYPSTEWDMAQAFDCSCGADQCLGKIQGAKYLSIEELEARGLVNEHIRDLKEQQEEGGKHTQ